MTLTRKYTYRVQERRLQFNEAKVLYTFYTRRINSIKHLSFFFFFFFLKKGRATSGLHQKSSPFHPSLSLLLRPFLDERETHPPIESEGLNHLNGKIVVSEEITAR